MLNEQKIVLLENVVGFINPYLPKEEDSPKDRRRVDLKLAGYKETLEIQGVHDRRFSCQEEWCGRRIEELREETNPLRVQRRIDAVKQEVLTPCSDEVLRGDYGGVARRIRYRLGLHQLPYMLSFLKRAALVINDHPGLVSLRAQTNECKGEALRLQDKLAQSREKAGVTRICDTLATTAAEEGYYQLVDKVSVMHAIFDPYLGIFVEYPDFHQKRLESVAREYARCLASPEADLAMVEVFMRIWTSDERNARRADQAKMSLVRQGKTPTTADIVSMLSLRDGYAKFVGDQFIADRSLRLVRTSL